KCEYHMHSSQHQEKHGDHEQPTLEHVLASRVDDEIHELGAVLHRRQFHVLRKRLFDLLQFLFEVAGDDMAILTHEHEAEAEHRFPSGVGSDGAPPDLVADLHLGDIANSNRRALLGGHDDILNLFTV